MQRFHYLLVLLAFWVALHGGDARAQVTIDTSSLPQEKAAQVGRLFAEAGKGAIKTKDDRGLLYDHAWRYQSALAAQEIFIDSELDVLGNVVYLRHTSAGQTSVEKLDVTGLSGATSEWQPPATSFSNATSRDLAIDLEGNIFVAMQASASRARLARVSPNGFKQWDVTHHDLTPPVALVLDPDGVPFAMGLNWAAQFDPVTGAIAWVRFFDTPFLAAPRPVMRLAADGSVFVAGTIDWGTHVGAAVYRLRGDTGDVSTFQGIGGRFLADMEILPDGHPLVYSFDPGDWGRLAKFVGESQISMGFVHIVHDSNFNPIEHEPPDMEIDPVSGYVYCAARAATSVQVEKFHLEVLEGSWIQLNNAVGLNFVDLALDRLGNPYILAKSSTEQVVLKLSGSDGAYVWGDLRAGGAGNTSSPRRLFVDGGGSVYTAGTITGGIGAVDAYVDKFTQPFTSVPTIQFATPHFLAEGRSIWGPGTGHLVADEQFFSLPVDFDVPLQDFEDTGAFGEWGGGIFMSVEGTIGLGARAEISGGSADIDVPLRVTWVAPGREKLYPDGPVFILADHYVGPAAKFTTCFDPDANAGITGSISGADIYGDFILRAFSEDLVNTVIVDEEFESVDGYLPGLNVWDILSTIFPGIQDTNGRWISGPAGPVQLSFRTPKLVMQSRFNPITGKFSAAVPDYKFMKIGLSVTDLIVSLATGGQLSIELAQTNGEFGFALAAGVIQAYLDASLGMSQTIDVKVTPKVTYTFDDGVSPITQNLDEDLFFFMPSDNSVVITPNVFVELEFTNNTGLKITPGVGFDFAKFSASAHAFGTDVFDVPEFCFPNEQACFRADIPIPPIPLFPPLGYPELGTWTVTMPAQAMPPIILDGGGAEPSLTRASRPTLPMIIYDQTTPTRSKFNVAVNGFTNIVLYGRNFFDLNELTVKLQHYGQTADVPVTRLHDNALLVSIPKRFQLLPGVAKLWVTTTYGSSNALDMPIAYPVPRIDAVNPNLWAADPEMTTIPVQVIDAKSFAGNDTFIARRDYYILMRDMLWNNSTAGGMGAAAYFPAFDFDQLPGFPSVLFDGTPLPRFIQPIDNGIHNLRLAESFYDRPKLIDVVVCNPGPGGGDSNRMTLNVAAPVPVIQSVTPDEVEPDHFGDVTLSVIGPQHVPWWVGYEEPKFGNFNADSIVRFDGTDLQTTFVSSFQLEAVLPVALLGGAGEVRNITVFTPANGTVYFEELRDGNGQIVAQGHVASGGESAPYPFTVRYADPVIRSISPPSTSQGNPLITGTGSLSTLAVSGENLRPGAVVLVNGNQRATTWRSKTLVEATLLPQDVAQVGDYQVRVLNSSPAARMSQPVLFEVTAPSPLFDAYREGRLTPELIKAAAGVPPSVHAK